MDKYSIGFRMQFDDVKPEDIVERVTDYLDIFDRYEIKVTNNIISSGKIYELLEVSRKLADGRYSLHIPKDALVTTQSYNETQKLVEILRNYKNTKRVYLITHIPYGDFQKYLAKILNILVNLPTNYTLLLENEKVERDNKEYMLQINKLCAWLCKYEIANVGVCLDIGHLLFGAYREGITQEYCLEQLARMSYILPMIMQVHIHDYLCIDHLQLGKGLINLENVSEFIIEKGLKIPIIIETTVEHPKYDGKNQVVLMDKALKKVKETIE